MPVSIITLKLLISNNIPYTLTSFNGCDSIVVNSEVENTLFRSKIYACGIRSFNGQIISEMECTLIRVYLGCDSVLLFSLVK